MGMLADLAKNRGAVLLQASMSTRLTAQLAALSSLPAHTAAPATASLLHALHVAMERYPADPIQQGEAHQHPSGLHSLYATLLQQSLSQLLGGAVAAFAALTVMGHAEGGLGDQPLVLRLLALLGQVSCLCTHAY